VGPGEVESRLQRFESLCRERGLPLTVQRRDILRVVLKRDDHPTADQVCEAVRGRIPGLSLTTVYRVLDTLVGLGVIRRLHHPGAGARFDGKVHRHHHLICTKCHKVVDIESPSLDGLEPPADYEEEFDVDDYAVHFFGVCAACRRAASG